MTEKIESPLTGGGFPSPPLYIMNPTALIQGRALELSTQRSDLILKVCSIYTKPVTSDKALCKSTHPLSGLLCFYSVSAIITLSSVWPDQCKVVCSIAGSLPKCFPAAPGSAQRPPYKKWYLPTTNNTVKLVVFDTVTLFTGGLFSDLPTVDGCCLTCWPLPHALVWGSLGSPA